MEGGGLQKDLGALVRVRNRLAQSPDSALPKILTGLLPRLLRRLDKLCNNTPFINRDDKVLAEKTNAQLRGILSHALERIRGGRHALPPGAPWVPALLPLLQENEEALESPLAVTFLLLILQNSMPRCINEDGETSSVEQQQHPTDISTTLPAVMDFVHQLHFRIATLSTSSPQIPESLLLHYRQATWICFDIVALTWGLPALMDWDRDHFDEYDWCTPTSAKEAFLEHGPSRHPHSNSFHQRSVNYLATSGSFHLWLDLLLFWPAESKLNRRLVRTNEDILVENSTGMTPEGLERLNHRRNRQGQQQQQQSWNERYLRELKLACMECVVVEPLRSVTPNSFAKLDDNQNVPTMRSLILCILTASTGSMHGKIAIEHVNKIGLMIASNIAQTSSNNSCRSHQLPSSSDPWGCNEGSLLLACSLLSLVLGDRLAVKVMEKHPRERKRIEVVLGPFAVKPSSAQDGDEDDTAPLQRAPMPFGVAERAMDFILTRLLPPCGESGPKLASKPGWTLLTPFIDLVVQLPVSNGVIGSYWAIQCLERLSGPITSSLSSTTRARSEEEKDGRVRGFHDTCLDISVQVLSQIAQVDAESNVQFGEIQHPVNPHAQLPGGVPGPFRGRRDLNIMLAQHRSSQKKRQLQVNCALKARQTAYRMVAELTTSRDLVANSSTPPSGREDGLKSSPILEMPTVLLKCATGEEDPIMHPYVTKALDAVLVAYKNAIPKVDARRLESLVASLLPSLLCSVCADSSVARLAASRWAVEFVQSVDPGVTWHVCAFLAQDIDPLVAGVAQQALKLKVMDTPMEGTITSCQILDVKREQDKELIRKELESLAKVTASSLGVPCGIARALLSDFKFDAKVTIAAYKSDQAVTLGQSGISCLGERDVRMKESSESFCGICYDVLEEDHTYELVCEHQFCSTCWRSYLECVLKERPSNVPTPLRVICPEQDCSERVILSDVQAVAPDLLPQWEDIVLRSYIGCSEHLSSCPGPDCSAVAHISPIELQPHDLRRTITCVKCATPFCFSCSSDPHQPANCDAFAEWNRIFGSSQYWVKKNAKPCPNCKVPIEKNQGCNHMRCSQCRHDFCWLCLGHLRTHLEPHICNRYEPHQSAEDEEERRALFFTDRFKAHDDAEVFAKGELRSFQEKKKKLASETLWFASDEDLDNMLHATRTLVRARNFLKNSYVAAWAMRNDLEHRDVFESHQANLELFTEKLSQLLLTKIHQLYTQEGARGIHMHFRAMTFSTASVVRYMDRLTSFVYSP